jgi:prolyl-tRNA synthetase
MNLYQISFKFRDEFRPRFGVLRSREFIMKDAYSFHDTPESLDETYKAMYDAYCRIFKRCGLQYVIVEAEVGEMGGSGSHQFTIPCQSGEDTIVYTEDNSYTANLERAEVDPPPSPVIPSERSESRNLPKPELIPTPNIGSIEAVCAFLKTQPKDMIKTLIYSSSKNTHIKDIHAEKAKHDGRKFILSHHHPFRDYVILIRGDHEVNQEKLFQLLGEHIELANEATIKEITNAEVGFAGPVKIADKVYKLIIDHAVAAMAVGVTGANKTDYHVKNVVPGRDFPLEGENIMVADIRIAVEGDTYNGKKLLFKKGIEVGQVFKLGTKYSIKLGAKFLDEHGQEKPCIMGCYGIGINRILASAVELGNDENGIIWPISIAPFEVIITCVNQEDSHVAQTAEKIYQQLFDKGIDVLLDDRDLRAGVKFKDADLIGIPVRVTIGQKSLAEGNVEIKLRTESATQTTDKSQIQKVPVEEAPDKIIELVNLLKEQLKA